MINNLPFDLKLEVIKYLDLPTFINLYQTNREYHLIINEHAKITDLSFCKQIPKHVKTMNQLIKTLHYCHNLAEHKKPMVCGKCEGTIAYGEWIVSLCDCLKDLIQFVKKSDKRYRHIFPHELVMYHKECATEVEKINFRTRIFRCPMCNSISCGYLAALWS